MRISSGQVLSFLEKIKQSKDRKLNKLGECLKKVSYICRKICCYGVDLFIVYMGESPQSGRAGRCNVSEGCMRSVDYV